MPDTGAPWNIPYVEATDLVRDWPTDSEALADAIADGLDAAGNAGIGSNVVSVTKTDISSGFGSIADIPGLTVTITPTSDTSKVLIVGHVVIGNAGNEGGANVILVRDGTPISVGDAAGSRARVTASWYQRTAANVGGSQTSGFMFLDSPETTSAVVYKVQALGHNQASVTVNVSNSDADTLQDGRAVSSLTAIEVAG